jgi:hypothetical protein
METKKASVFKIRIAEFHVFLFPPLFRNEDNNETCMEDLERKMFVTLSCVYCLQAECMS